MLETRRQFGGWEEGRKGKVEKKRVVQVERLGRQLRVRTTLPAVRMQVCAGLASGCPGRCGHSSYTPGLLTSPSALQPHCPALQRLTLTLLSL